MRKFLCSFLALTFLTISSTNVMAAKLYNPSYGWNDGGEVETNNQKDIGNL